MSSFLRFSALVRLPALAALLYGCGPSLSQVKIWEEEGNLPALKEALAAKNPEVRSAATRALVSYANYDTSRPPMLATLEKSPSPEAKEGARSLIGKPPVAAPDPDKPDKTLSASAAVIYFYRPEEKGDSLWLSVDGRKVVRLLPGRHYRYQTSVGSHKVALQIPGEEGDPPADMRFVVGTPMRGVYFVMHRRHGNRGKPSFDVKPVPPALSALGKSKASAEADVAPNERARTNALQVESEP